MTKLNHLFIIPDAGRRYARREYLADLFKKSPKKIKELLFNPLNPDIISEKDFSELEKRISDYVRTGQDSICEHNVKDPLNSNKIYAPLDYVINSYRKGGNVFDTLIRHILERDICSILSIYALQKRNLERTDEETYAMLKVEPEFFRRWAKDKEISNQCDFKFVGDKGVLELHKHRPKLKETIEDYIASVEELEKKSSGSKLKIYVLTPYDSDWEINQAVVDGKFNPQNLIVREPVNLIIRCGNSKMPISGGLPYQTQFAQFISIKEYFPDLNINIFNEALNKYDDRKREPGL